jgi:hypothetical protein
MPTVGGIELHHTLFETLQPVIPNVIASRKTSLESWFLAPGV